MKFSDKVTAIPTLTSQYRLTGEVHSANHRNALHIAPMMHGVTIAYFTDIQSNQQFRKKVNN
ncbi:MAG: hypothetical protein COV97_09425 [Zetaproteobacteria bacterium CG11_big_fil_rev_8_21_14_0_20_59_439]|nr:MAG: hypothetical protein AUK36_04425 [Zetaproteobacteria bacterium CG2_30_59_37]PIO89788.1 MAG: hypothetical protein COX56_05175 [Zetaproteobacteria bacterium CG23_combo_of_CG06-09_8_20_14_all_59_86]PIQ64153.1 MAG: hypothetical protein COV97_09425 [Zetaproteobacteria bacterium CG11_big_fil_rev_8_21_14_0_20_59_439]PIU96029.1 MAG: hypothetical protein COS62_11260 [Zetaproteobacteria bacterium CG03_land_8_20_14_0_80_59_51]HCS12221.1 hypothetical protein [Zetaproteobacteria bacterium]